MPEHSTVSPQKQWSWFCDEKLFIRMTWKIMLPEAEQVLKVRVWFHLQHHQSGLPWFVLGQLPSVEILWIYSPVSKTTLSALGTGSDMQIEQSEPNSAPGYIHAIPLKSLSAFFVCLMHCSISCSCIILFFPWQNLLQFSPKNGDELA